jgi:hypothetical protein
MKRSPLLTAALFAAVFPVACGGGGTPGELDSTGVDQELPDIRYDIADSDVTSDRVTTDDGDCQITLGYADPVMDDPANGYHLELSFNGQRDMRVKATACNAVAPDVSISYEEVSDPDDLCSLDLEGFPTDADGISSVIVGSPQSALEGECTFKACQEGTDNCLTFNVHVVEKVKVPLSVGFAEYTGVHPQVSLGYVRLFKKADPSKNRCDSLKSEALPTASDGRGPISILLTAKFETLKNLETELTQSYTVYCYATEPGSDQKRAYGCVDDVTVEAGAKRFVECPLDDIPPKIVGSYNLTTTLNMVSGLPPQVQLVVNYIIDFLQSPTGAILKLMCDPNIWGANGGALQGLCEYIFVDITTPDIDNLTTIGTIARDIIDALLMSLLEANCPDKVHPETCSQVFTIGGDVGEMLRKLTLLSTMKCDKEPGQDGLIALGDCSEKWHSVVIYWTLGKNCAPSDPTCGAVQLSLNSLPGMGGTITADIEARLVEKNTRLAITKHPVNLKYGALIDFVLEKILLPQVFGNGSDGLPAVDSFEAMIGSLLAGKACLQTGTCCHDFAVNLVGQTGGALGVNLVEGACDALINTGGQYVRSFLTDLDTDTSNFQIGTPADTPCAIFDKNNDMKFDALGAMPVEQQCLWDATLTLGNIDYSPDATFYGNRL